jgi:hypothetical protein
MLHARLLQVMARVVSHGPDGRMLNATFREADKLEYQDSLGRLTLEVAQAVPDGVLLFMPSYSLMDKLRERWKVRWGLVGGRAKVLTDWRRGLVLNTCSTAARRAAGLGFQGSYPDNLSSGSVFSHLRLLLLSYLLRGVLPHCCRSLACGTSCSA